MVVPDRDDCIYLPLDERDIPAPRNTRNGQNTDRSHRPPRDPSNRHRRAPQPYDHWDET